nr:hypothetical protein [Xaviernesmea rhizosphaerae]
MSASETAVPETGDKGGQLGSGTPRHPAARPDRLKERWRSIKAKALGLDDGALMRHAFQILLAAALVFVVIDFREIEAAKALVPFDPQAPGAAPILPPALTEGEPEAPPSEITTEAEQLKNAIRFELLPGGILKAQGAIDPGAAARFAAEVEARGEYVKTVVLDSPGGSVGDALAMSRLIRERQLDTRVEKGALCASSCPIVFAGGVQRVAEKGAVIGVHQIFNGSTQRLTPEEAMSQAQRTTAEVTRHLEAMGVKPGLWRRALETPPDRLFYLSAREMEAEALTTPPPPRPVAASRGKGA